jgi:hypothetical protein
MWSELKRAPEDGPETVETSVSARLAMYRGLEQLARRKAEAAASEYIRESYRNIARGWATLSTHIERVGERAALQSVLHETETGSDVGEDSKMSELEKLSPVEQAMACRSKAEELAADVLAASPEKADELRKLSRQWLLRAQQLEDGNEHLAAAIH